MRDTDLQFLAKVMRMVRLREQYLRQAAAIESELAALHGACRPEIRRTIDRLVLMETNRLDRRACDQDGGTLSRN